MGKDIPKPLQDTSAPLRKKRKREGKETNAIQRSNKIPVVSLFCGSGGLDLGFEQAGFHPVVALDHNDAALETYNLNHGRNVSRKCDLGILTCGELVKMVRDSGVRPRAVIGGPPCQSFSRSNTNKKRRDPRARLGVSYGMLIAALNKEFGLDFVVFENVTGLGGKQHRSRFATIQRELRRGGFNLFQADLDAQHFGVPQRRRRLIIVGINREKFPWLDFKFPEGMGEPKTVRQAIGHLPRPAFFNRELTAATIPVHPNHWTMNPRSPKFSNGVQGEGRSFRRLAWDKPSLTVAYGNREIHVHPEGDRRLSVLEAMLLQGFPQSYQLMGSLSDQVVQVSDAVPPPLAKAVALSIRQQLYQRVAALQFSILRWFKQNRRHFPWRETSDPLRVLIAEKLLQQTAATEYVTRAFDELVSVHGDSASLAKADVRSIERTIAPLGFIYRARELVVLGRTIRDRHGGRMPCTHRELMALPGVGDYGARAVLSFAYHQDVAVVDTNVVRFLTRYFGLSIAPSQNPARSRALHRIADAVIPAGKSRQFNWAILDLCAAYCKARQPSCNKCPLRANCFFNANRLSAKDAKREQDR